MPTVREAAFRVFEHFGVDRLFGNPGSTELPMLKALPEGFRYVLGLNEAVVVAMADGFARSSRQAGAGQPAQLGRHRPFARQFVHRLSQQRTRGGDRGAAGALDPAARSVPVRRAGDRIPAPLRQISRSSRPAPRTCRWRWSARSSPLSPRRWGRRSCRSRSMTGNANASCPPCPSSACGTARPTRRDRADRGHARRGREARAGDRHRLRQFAAAGKRRSRWPRNAGPRYGPRLMRRARLSPRTTRSSPASSPPGATRSATCSRPMTRCSSLERRCSLTMSKAAARTGRSMPG